MTNFSKTDISLKTCALSFKNKGINQSNIAAHIGGGGVAQPIGNYVPKMINIHEKRSNAPRWKDAVSRTAPDKNVNPKIVSNLISK